MRINKIFGVGLGAALCLASVGAEAGRKGLDSAFVDFEWPFTVEVIYVT